MSFSSEVKEEICEKLPRQKASQKAMLSGILLTSGRIREQKGKLATEIRAESPEADEVIQRLLPSAGIPAEDLILSDDSGHHRKLVLASGEKTLRLEGVLKLQRSGRFFTGGENGFSRIPPAPFVSGAFLGGGSIGSPKKSYQMEFLLRREPDAEGFLQILCSLEKNAGMVTRGPDRFIVYLKDGDSISDLIGRMGASRAMMEFENARILKGLRNSVNREVNCDTANMARTAGAAARQMEDIRVVSDKIGLDNLEEPLQEIARARLQHPFLTLQELGKCLTPPLGKSGVRHRLEKIGKIADSVR